MQGVARTGTQLGLVRFWMGTGECGNYSGGLKVVSRLFSPRERTLAIGIFNSGSMIGATVAPPLIVYLLQHYGFRAAFLMAAALGALWLPLWYWVYRGPAALETGCTDALTSVDHAPVATRVSIADRSLWAIMLCRFFIGPVMQFYWYWIPSYLFSARHLSISQIGFLAWIPFLLGDIGGLAGGGAAGLLQRRGLRIDTVRRWTMYTSSLLCVASLLVPVARSTALAFLLIGVAMLADNFLSANMFGSMTDLFPEHQLGRVTGFSGVAGGLSGLLFPLLTGVLVDRFSYTPVFVIVALMPLAGTAALFILGRQGYKRIAGATSRDLSKERAR
jgi:ACS family hexuronate transporter-like MFS transporter